MARYDGFETLRVSIHQGVAWLTIDHPPINLLDPPLFTDLARVIPQLEEDQDVRVIVFQSADQDFFIAHADVNWILTLPENAPPRSTQLSPFVAVLDRLRCMPKVTIGCVNGVARGGGSELLLSLDLRFAGRNRTRLAQPEAALGIIPGGGATQRLTRLIGRPRALEIMLGCEDVDADTAAAIGYVNRVFAEEDLLPFVETFANRVAALPPETVRLLKQSVDAVSLPVEAGLVEEGNLFNESAALPEARRRMRAFLETGGQTRDVEFRLGNLVRDLGRR